MSKKKEDNMWTDVFLVLPDLTDFGLVLDEEFMLKRQNRYTMAEKKQPRDKNGRFASADGALELKDALISRTSADWQKLYDRKVVELNMKEGLVKKLDAKVGEQEAIIKDMDRIIGNLRENNKLNENRANFFEEKSDLFFDTIEKQNSHNSELREQLEWFKEHLPWYVKLFHFKTLQDMHERLCYLRMCALESMGKWK